MKKNDIFQVEIEDMSAQGLGIGHVNGMAFFIKDALVGDVVEASVTKLKKNYGYGRLRRVLQPSVYRVDPSCPLARACGGCQLQMMSYEAQLQWKQRLVTDNLRRIGGFDAALLERIMEPIIGMEHPFRYRNKAQYPVGMDKDGRIVMGFYAARTHHIIPVQDCLLGVEDNARVLSTVRDYMEACRVTPYDEATGKGLIRHIMIRKGFHSGELMVCVVANAASLPHEDKLCDMLAKIPGMRSVSLNVNERKTNVIMGDDVRILWGEPVIQDTIFRMEETAPGQFDSTQEGVTFRISPKSFFQVNPVQTQKLYSVALSYAGLTGKEIVWDLYCGIGTISLFLARRAKHVFGVEIVPDAIRDARENAAWNGIANATFLVGKAEEVLPDYFAGKHPQLGEVMPADVIVVDPPRKGCDSACLDTILAMQPERIVYVSCDSATLARDLQILAQGGYELRRIRAVDQFCHGGHVETVVLMSRVEGK